MPIPSTPITSLLAQMNAPRLKALFAQEPERAAQAATRGALPELAARPRTQGAA